MEAFEQVYAECRGAVERFIRFRIAHPADAEDVMQEVFCAAVSGYPALRDKASARAWMIGIARNKCTDWLRRKYRRNEITLTDEMPIAVIPPRFGLTRDSLVQDTLARLRPQDQQMLRLYYWQELPQQEIARRLGLPLGTVKSRLHTAREHFRDAFPARPKGEQPMKTIMPLRLPDYTIQPSDMPPFACKWEELMGWFIVPRVGEKLSWAMYDFPERTRTEEDHLTVVGRACIHGLEGVEIQVETSDPMPCNQTGDDEEYVQRSFIAQLTDDHCRILAETHTQGGVKQTFTYLDGDEFLQNWGFGEDNCGNETDLHAKGIITREGDVLTVREGLTEAMDVVGRYTVGIGGKSYDTLCVVMHEKYMGGMVSEQFIDRNGRTVLWRRFNADDWHQAHYGRTWSEMLPDAETLTVNGKKYVHWYDCITSYIL